jgi:hypothetical protein
MAVHHEGHPEHGRIQPDISAVSGEEPSPDSDLAIRVAKLWPHREHEANSALALVCRLGLHRWRRLDLRRLVPDKDILHCFWCSRVKIDGIVYES